jgi:hypothetical protein
MMNAPGEEIERTEHRGRGFAFWENFGSVWPSLDGNYIRRRREIEFGRFTRRSGNERRREVGYARLPGFIHIQVPRLTANIRSNLINPLDCRRWGSDLLCS